MGTRRNSKRGDTMDAAEDRLAKKLCAVEAEGDDETAVEREDALTAEDIERASGLMDRARLGVDGTAPRCTRGSVSMAVLHHAQRLQGRWHAAESLPARRAVGACQALPASPPPQDTAPHSTLLTPLPCRSTRPPPHSGCS